LEDNGLIDNSLAHKSAHHLGEMHGHCGRVLTSFFFIQPHSWQTLILISSLLGCASLVKVEKMPQIDPKSNPVRTFVILGLKMIMIVLKVLFKSFNKKMSNPSSSNLKWNLVTQFPLLWDSILN
jgi:hypothetical protein